MAELIRTITEKAQFEKILYKFFLNNETFLKTKNGDIKTKFLGSTGDTLALKIPFVKNMYESCVVFTRYESYTIYAWLKFAEKQEEDVYIFTPVKFQFISIARREDRKVLDLGGEGKRVIYATNIMSDFIMQNCLALESKKAEHVKETVRFGLVKQFPMVRVFFFNEGTGDARMRYFADNKKAFFIQDVNRKEPPENPDQYNFYLNEIYGRDRHLVKRGNIVSEICMPVFHGGRIIFGYIQVNGTAPLSESHLAAVRRTAVLVEQLFDKYGVFPVARERLLVSDVSQNGCGIVFRERRFIRYFKERCHLCLDLALPANKKALVLAVVRNIGILENKVVKIGCEIKDLDSTGRAHYEEYLASLGVG